jgi:hypothetical protein
MIHPPLVPPLNGVPSSRSRSQGSKLPLLTPPFLMSELKIFKKNIDLSCFLNKMLLSNNNLIKEVRGWEKDEP